MLAILQNSVRYQSQNMDTCIKKAPLLRYLHFVRLFSDICWPLTPAICLQFQFFLTTYNSEEVVQNHLKGSGDNI